MADRTVNEVLVKMGIDPAGWTRGLATATKETNKFVTSLQSNAKTLAGISLGGTLTLAGMQRAIKDVTNEAAQQEAAIGKLTSNLRAEQRTRDNSIGILTRQADELQKVTEFADEQIISLQGTLAAFGQNDQAIEQLVPRVLDLAAGFRDAEGNALDLNTISLALGKALNGNSSALQRLGIDLNLAKGETLTLEKAVEAIDRQFKGAAEAAGTTFAGQMKIAQHQISEVKEALGTALMPTILQVTKAIVPHVEAIGKWVSENQKLVLMILGGGLGGVGLVSALATLGFAVAALGGPLTLAILGIGTLVGALVTWKLTNDTVPKTVDAVTQELDAQVKKFRELEDQIARMPEPFSIFSVGSKKNDLREELEETRKRITLLGSALADLRKAERERRGALGESDPAFVGPQRALFDAASEGDKDAAKKAQDLVDKSFDAMKTRIEGRAHELQTAWRESATLEGVLAGEGELAPVPVADLVIPEDQLALIDERFQQMRDTDQSTWAAITDDRSAFIERQNEELDAWAQHQTAIAMEFVDIWATSYMHIAEAEKNFAAAFGKAFVLTLLRVLQKQVDAAIGEILIEKLKELGKAAVRAPLSLGASLAATGPIIAAAAAATAGLRAATARLSKSFGSFETGGIVPRTGPYLVHENEVIFNPRRNSTAELASNLARVGRVREAAALTNTENGGGTTVRADLYIGSISSKVEIQEALDRFTRKLGRAMGPRTA